MFSEKVAYTNMKRYAKKWQKLINGKNYYPDKDGYKARAYFDNYEYWFHEWYKIKFKNNEPTVIEES